METDQQTVEHKGLRKGLYLVPSVFTAANIAMGFLSVLASVRGFQLVSGDAADIAQAALYFDFAAKAIGFAILFDTLDGRIARLTKTASEIGVQLDSLADVLTFGIAPTVLIFSWSIGAAFPEESAVYRLGVFVLFMYLMCGVFRLARFNLQALRPRVIAAGSAKVDKKHFVGLPIPVAAGLLAAIVHFWPSPIIAPVSSSPRFYTVAIIVLTAGLGLLMVSTIKYKSFKEAGLGKSGIYPIILLAAGGMLIWLYSRYFLLTLAVLFVSHGVVLYLAGFFTRNAIETTSVEIAEPASKSDH
jgi:CDP-diacylglycerol--serine O-phosphatidyltransferase